MRARNSRGACHGDSVGSTPHRDKRETTNAISALTCQRLLTEVSSPGNVPWVRLQLARLRQIR